MPNGNGFKEALSEINSLLNDKEFAAHRQELERLRTVVSSTLEQPANAVVDLDKINQALALIKVGDISNIRGGQVNITGGDRIDQQKIQQDIKAERFFNFIFTPQAQQEPETSIPIVLLVMNAAQMQTLVDGTAFEGDQELQAQFEVFKGRLEQNLPNWGSRYGNTPKDWQPFTLENDLLTIEQFIQTVFADMPGLTPRVLDIQELRESNDLSLHEWIYREGGVVIMDSISMRHPEILRALLDSDLPSNRRVFCLTVSPLPMVSWALDMAIKVQLHVSKRHFVRRIFDADDEDFSEQSSKTNVLTWLKKSIKALRPSQQAEGIPKHWNNLKSATQ